ncbi:MAG TPA: hypothetical protein PKX50_10970, partial [Thermomonas sp.]|nr:hypothetical protein [Thermomonas sp.]
MHAALVAAIYPIMVHALQLLAIAQKARHQKADRGITEFQLGGASWQAEHSANRLRPAISQNLLQHDAGQRTPKCVQGCRGREGSAARGGYPDIAMLVTNGGRPGAAVALCTDQPICFTKMIVLKALMTAIQNGIGLGFGNPQYAAIGCKPIGTQLVIDNGKQGIHGQAIMYAKPRQMAIAIAQQAAIGAAADGYRIA